MVVARAIGRIENKRVGETEREEVKRGAGPIRAIAGSLASGQMSGGHRGSIGNKRNVKQV